MDHRSILAQRFRDFEHTATSRAPLYARLARSIADDSEILALLDDAEPEQRIPVLLFAAVHLLLLEGLGTAAAVHYPNLRRGEVSEGGDPFPSFRQVALDHADRVRDIAATHRTQTNEVGRCALYLPALDAVAAEVGVLALVDIGASAGLNLLLPRYGYDYGGEVLAPDSPVILACSIRGEAPTGFSVPSRVPAIAAWVGLDAAPVDVLDDDAVRWLEACVWPDMTERFDRLVSAVALAREAPPRVERGDAVADVGRLVGQVVTAGHPVVLTSWVMNYLPVDRQRAFVEELDRLGSETDLSWVVAESPAETPGLPIPTTAPPDALTVVSLVRWRIGRRTIDRLGVAHPHGYWLRWD